MSHRQRSVLQVEELESRLTPMLVKSATMGFFLLYDQNHNGKITYGPGQEITGQDITGPNRIEFVARLDRNHDGNLTKHELTHFLRRQVDLNHNGELDDLELALFGLRDPGGYSALFLE